MMTPVNSATEIANLLYRYAEYWDAGDLEGAAALFEHAQVRRVRKDGTRLYSGVAELLQHWRGSIITYPDGTPRTRHVVTNPLLEIDEGKGTATSRSYCTVFQATPDLPLQAITIASHHDTFERVDGRWRFSARDYRGGEILGDMSGHIRGDYVSR